MAEEFYTVSSSPSEWAIYANGLTKQFGEEYAVRDLTFQIPPGKIVGFIGPSGCGKTTTVRLLTGVYEPTSGKAEVMGVHPKDFRANNRSKIGYLPQLFFLYPDLSVLENINFAASLYGLGFFQRRKRIKRMLEFVELEEHRNKLARNISGGMQRRLSLAATLVHDPEILFMDEPTAGIDPILRQKFWDHFHELQNQGRTLFVTTQYVGEAAYCDYIGVMADGRLLMVETPQGLRLKAYGGEIIDIQTKEPLNWNQIQQLENMQNVRGRIAMMGNNIFRIIVDEASTALPALLEWLKLQNVNVESAGEYLPPFDDVFVKLIQEETANA